MSLLMRIVTSDEKHVNDPDDYDVVIYRTKSAGDAERYVRYICRTKLGTDPDWTINGFVQRTGDEQFRFYACGGDGTLNEVVNGCYGFDGAEVACIPCGTGDDYIKCYPDAGDFTSISAQMDGKAVDSDLIRYTPELQHRRPYSENEKGSARERLYGLYSQPSPDLHQEEGH